MFDRGVLKKWWGPACLVIVLVLAGTDGDAATDRTVMRLNVLGSAEAGKKNLATSRQDAVQNALDTAVGQAVIEMLSAETVVQQFQLIAGGILAKPENYVKNYRVLTESVSGNAVKTLVQVDVAADRLEQDLVQAGVVVSGADVPQTTFTVVVEGTGGKIASFVRLRTAMASLSGVKELAMTEMSPDGAVMSVDYQGNTRSLADALLQQTFDGFGIDIVEVTADTVRVRLKP